MCHVHINFYTVNNIPSYRNNLILDVFYIISSIFYKILHLHYNYLAGYIISISLKTSAL